MINFSLEAWHDWLFETLLFLLALGIVVSLLKIVQKETFRWLFPVLNALLLTVFTVSCSGRFPFLLEEQTLLFSQLHHVHNSLHQNQHINTLLGDNRFLLVDVSHDLALIPDSSINATYGPNQLITDRPKLARFIESLTSSQDSVRSFVDMVVCDLTFGDASPDKSQDNRLQAAFNTLNSQNRLLIAKSTIQENKSVYDHSAIDTDKLAGGSVDITKFYEGTFFSYRFFDKKSPSKASLPALLFEKLSQPPAKTEPARQPTSITQRPIGTLWPSDLFVPDFWIDNDDVSLESKPIAEPTEEPKSESGGTLQEASGQLRSSVFYLGQVTDTTEFGGRELFLDQLLDNRNKGKKTVVFIGVFEDPSRDMHQTLIGPMHGSILLLNMFLNLLAGSHLISIWYLIYLLAGFWLVGYLLIQEPYQLLQPEPQRKSRVWRNVLNWLQERGYQLVQKGIENRVRLLAFVVLLGAISFFNHLINLVIIGVYIEVVSEVFEELYHQKTEPYE